MQKNSGEQFPDNLSGKSTDSCVSSDEGGNDVNNRPKLESNIYSDVQNNLFDTHDHKDEACGHREACNVDYCEATRGTRKKAFTNAEER